MLWWRNEARYAPTRNQTLTNFEFHKMKQGATEVFDTWVDRVKREANNCSFKCDSPTCTVRDTLVQDQVLIGTTDGDIQKCGLKDEWNLTDLQTKGRKMEAAAFGAA